MFIEKAGSSLTAIYGMDSQGRPAAVPMTSAYGVKLSEAQTQAISNSKFFEAGASMSLLDEPGKVGDVFDDQASKLANLLECGLREQSKAGDMPVYFLGRRQPLRDVLVASVMMPLSSSTDQIGRQGESDVPLQTWLLYTLSTSLRGQPDGSGKQGFSEFLTKVRTLGAFGGTLWNLMHPQEDPQQPQLYSQHKAHNTAACIALLREAGFDVQADRFVAQFNEFSVKTHAPAFDDPVTRARSERMPMVVMEGKLRPVAGLYEDGGKFGLGFGQVVQNTVDPRSTEQSALRKALGPDNENINAIRRDGAPIEDVSRPFTMSEMDIKNVPEPYAKLDIVKMLEEHKVVHGTGINRWQVYGSFAMESNLQGRPSGGSQSGSTCNTLLALNTLSPEGIYGNPDLARPAGLGIAAFMNFGAYHTFAETYPIAEAAAVNRPYIPTNTSVARQADLYQKMEAVTQRYSPQACGKFAEFRQSHGQVLEGLRQQHPDLGFYVPAHAEIHGTAQQIKQWRDSMIAIDRSDDVGHLRRLGLKCLIL